MSDQQRLQVHLPADLEPVYSNLTILGSTSAEFIFDFVLALPRQEPQGHIVARVLMSPRHALKLRNAIDEHAGLYEEQHGTIPVDPIPIDLSPTRAAEESSD